MSKFGIGKFKIEHKRHLFLLQNIFEGHIEKICVNSNANFSKLIISVLIMHRNFTTSLKPELFKLTSKYFYIKNIIFPTIINTLSSSTFKKCYVTGGRKIRSPCLRKIYKSVPKFNSALNHKLKKT